MIFTLLFFSLIYLVIAGGTGKQIHQLGQHKCAGAPNRPGFHDWEHCGHYYSGIIGGMFWPLALPVAAGMKGGEKVPTPVAKEIKAENKRKEELKNVQHQAQLEQAELMREEQIDRRLELAYRRAEHEGKLLELSAKGVDTDAIKRSAGLED